VIVGRNSPGNLDKDQLSGPISGCAGYIQCVDVAIDTIHASRLVSGRTASRRADPGVRRTCWANSSRCRSCRERRWRRNENHGEGEDQYQENVAPTRSRKRRQSNNGRLELSPSPCLLAACRFARRMIECECTLLIESHDDQLPIRRVHSWQSRAGRRCQSNENKDVGWVHRYRILLVVEKYLSWILEFLNEALTISLLQFGTVGQNCAGGRRGLNDSSGRGEPAGQWLLANAKAGENRSQIFRSVIHE
jgi:hypothetical protein